MSNKYSKRKRPIPWKEGTILIPADRIATDRVAKILKHHGNGKYRTLIYRAITDKGKLLAKFDEYIITNADHEELSQFFKLKGLSGVLKRL
jgi:hypothetical protein